MKEQRDYEWSEAEDSIGCNRNMCSGKVLRCALIHVVIKSQTVKHRLKHYTLFSNYYFKERKSRHLGLVTSRSNGNGGLSLPHG